MDNTLVDNDRRLNNHSLKTFCSRLLKEGNEPDLVIAIARKMPRLLEYFKVMDKSDCQIITERAIPWLPASIQKTNIRICDDVLNIGSTILHYAQYVKNNNLGQIQLYVYAGKKVEKERQIEFDCLIQEQFSESNYQQFETSLPQELLTIGKPYDIDFPIISIPISEENASMSDEGWHFNLQKYFPSVHILTTYEQIDAGIVSISIINPLLYKSKTAIENSSEIAPIEKIRLFISKGEKILRIVPIFIQPANLAFLKTKKQFTDGNITALYNSLYNTTREAEPYPLEPVYNLLLFLQSFEYGKAFLPHLGKCLAQEEIKPTLSQIDLNFIFGIHVGLQINDTLSESLKNLADTVPVRRKSLIHPCSTAPIPLKNEVVEQIVAFLKDDGYTGSGINAVFREAIRVLSKLNNAKYPASKNSLPPYIRLRKGISLHDLWSISCALCPKNKPTFEEMSFLLDYYVDLGVVVPVVEEIDGLYLRTYREGEASPIEFAELIHWLLVKHMEEYKQPLTITHFTKIVAAMAIYQRKLIPIEPRFRLHGTTSIIKPQTNDEILTKAEDTISFLSRKQVICTQNPQKWEHESLPLFGE